MKTVKDIKYLIISHQFGIAQSMREIKKTVGNDVIIIEDVSDSWNLIDSGYNAGLYSDYVVTSFDNMKAFALD